LLFAGWALLFKGGMTEQELVAHSKIAYKRPRCFRDWKVVEVTLCHWVV
jgi:hypothetical protein